MSPRIIMGASASQQQQQQQQEHQGAAAAAIEINRMRAALIRTHWGDWQRDRAKRRGGGAGWKVKAAAERDRWERQRQRDEQERARWHKARPAILREMRKKIEAAPVTPRSPVARLALFRGEAMPRADDLEQLIRRLALRRLEQLLNLRIRHEAPKLGRALGVNTRRILDREAPVQTSARDKPRPGSGGRRKAPRGRPARSRR